MIRRPPRSTRTEPPVPTRRSSELKMLKEDLINVIPDSQGKLTIPTYLQMRVIIDDGMPTFGTGVDRKYLCILFGQGAIGYGRGNPRDRKSTRLNSSH